MRIAIDVSQAQYQGTGVGRYTTELVRHLYPLTSLDQVVLVAGSLRQRQALRQLFEPLPDHVIWKWLPFSPKIADIVFNRSNLSLERLIGKVDVVHTSDWTQPYTVAPSITTIHDLTPYLYPDSLHPRIVATHLRRLDRVKAHASHIITDAISTKEDIQSQFPDLAQPITAIPLAASQEFRNFAELERQPRARIIKAVLEKYQLGEYLLTVGTLEPRKNLPRVLSAFSRIAHKYPKLDLVIVGKVGWGPDLLQKIPDQLQNRIKLLGFVDNQDLPGLYRAARSLVYASLYEGFGLPVLEAMTVGCPVVTSSSGSLSEVGGKAVVRINPLSVGSIARGIEEALVDHKQLRQKGEAHATHYSWTKTAKATYEVYCRVAKTSVS